MSRRAAAMVLLVFTLALGGVQTSGPLGVPSADAARTTTTRRATSTTRRVTTTTRRVTTTTRPRTTTTAARRCDASYPTTCIPPAPPDLDCGEISARRFAVVGADPHGFDADDDGVGCES